MSQPQFFEYVCPYCQSRQRFPLLAQGKRGRCSVCRTIFVLPQEIATPTAPVAAGQGIAGPRPAPVAVVEDESEPRPRRSLSVLFLCLAALLVGGGIAAVAVLAYLGGQFEAGMERLAQPVPPSGVPTPPAVAEKDLSQLIPCVACLGGRRPYGHAVLVEHDGQLYLATLKEQLRFQQERILATFFDAGGKGLLTEEVIPAVAHNAPFAEVVLLGFTEPPDKVRSRLQEHGIRPVPLAKDVRQLRVGQRLYAIGRTASPDFVVSDHPVQEPARVCLLPNPVVGPDLQLFNVDWTTTNTVLPGAGMFNPNGELVGLYAQFVRLPNGVIAQNRPVVGADQIRQLLETPEVQERGEGLLDSLNIWRGTVPETGKLPVSTRPGDARAVPPEFDKMTLVAKRIYRPFAIRKFNTHPIDVLQPSQRLLLVLELEKWPEPACHVEIIANKSPLDNAEKVVQQYTLAERRAVFLFDPPAPGLYVLAVAGTPG